MPVPNLGLCLPHPVPLLLDTAPNWQDQQVWMTTMHLPNCPVTPWIYGACFHRYSSNPVLARALPPLLWAFMLSVGQVQSSFGIFASPHADLFEPLAQFHAWIHSLSKTIHHALLSTNWPDQAHCTLFVPYRYCDCATHWLLTSR